MKGILLVICIYYGFDYVRQTENIKIVTLSKAIIFEYFLNNQPDALIIPIWFCHKTLHVSCIFSAHHQQFSTVHSALVRIMQVSDDRFQAESGWNLLGSDHQEPAWNLLVPNVQYRTPDDGQRGCPKHVEFYNRIKLG